MSRRFPPPWTVEKIPGGFKVVDANQQSLAYVYARETKADADIQTNSQRAFSAGSARMRSANMPVRVRLPHCSP